MTHTEASAARILRGLAHPDPSVRLRAALAAGSGADAPAAALVRRCGVEPDFYVRDMLTWALTRLPADRTVPLLIAEVRGGGRQARSQALHTLSKIGDARAWPDIADAVGDGHPETARAAWRAAVRTVPPGEEEALAAALAGRLGWGDRAVRRSLSRALAALGPAADDALARAASGAGAAAAHARDIAALREHGGVDEDAVHEARRRFVQGEA